MPTTVREWIISRPIFLRQGDIILIEEAHINHHEYAEEHVLDLRAKEGHVNQHGAAEGHLRDLDAGEEQMVNGESIDGQVSERELQNVQYDSLLTSDYSSDSSNSSTPKSAHL